MATVSGHWQSGFWETPALGFELLAKYLSEEWSGLVDHCGRLEQFYLNAAVNFEWCSRYKSAWVSEEIGSG
jgi:hypothetical protein